jgi:hypothetical protein
MPKLFQVFVRSIVFNIVATICTGEKKGAEMRFFGAFQKIAT